MILTIATIVFSILTTIVILFQLGLALGLPWGKASMGGKYPGIYPPKMRIVAIVNMLILCFIALIVLTRATIFPTSIISFSRIGIWFVVAFFALGTVLNIITPSKIERIWSPVAALQLISAIIIGNS